MIVLSEAFFRRGKTTSFFPTDFLAFLQKIAPLSPGSCCPLSQLGLRRGGGGGGPFTFHIVYFCGCSVHLRDRMVEVDSRWEIHPSG